LTGGTTLVDRYVIQEVIGVGGMGSVYRARDLHFPNVVKLVAVKEMINQAPDPLIRATIVQNFEREANILATLSHPSIPRIYDYFSEDNRSYLVLEFINGRDLEQIINDTPGFLSEEQVLAWAIQLCDVLSFLHAHKPDPIVFRDMKPSNVMVNQANHIILVDFGIAKPFQTGQKGTMIGTEGYSPPEQYRGEATTLADIYALGATIHHALTRRDPRIEPPFSFSERPVRKINPAVSLELETVINSALQYNSKDRFPTIEAMRDALIGAEDAGGDRVARGGPVAGREIKHIQVVTGGHPDHHAGDGGGREPAHHRPGVQGSAHGRCRRGERQNTGAVLSFDAPHDALALTRQPIGREGGVDVFDHQVAALVERNDEHLFLARRA